MQYQFGRDGHLMQNQRRRRQRRDGEEEEEDIWMGYSQSVRVEIGDAKLLDLGWQHKRRMKTKPKRIS